MEHQTCPEQFTPPTVYDYRLYDRIWQRVSPDLDPYPEVRAAAQAEEESAPGGTAPQSPAVPAAASGGQTAARLAQLPGAELNPCCMGTEAQQSIDVLGGYIDEELGERQQCLLLARRVKNRQAAALFRAFAAEKLEAARRLQAAYFLITGSCYKSSILVEPAQWSDLCHALRTCYHQEACNGFNYQRSADEAVDQCLQKLLTELAQQSYRRADRVLELLGQVLR